MNASMIIQENEQNSFEKVKKYLSIVQSNLECYSSEDIINVYKRLKSILRKSSVGTFPIIHNYCRNSTYGDFQLPIRFSVCDKQVPWFVAFPDYKPIAFAVSTLSNQTNKDARNPVGRTGICGKGILKSFGPNKLYKILMIRWVADTMRGDPAKKLQIKAHCNIDKSYTLHFKMGSAGSSHLIYDGYLDSPYNTDNAWEEIRLSYELDGDSQNSWVDVDQIESTQPPYHDQLIRHLCDKLRIPNILKTIDDKDCKSGIENRQITFNLITTTENEKMMLLRGNSYYGLPDELETDVLVGDRLISEEVLTAKTFVKNLHVECKLIVGEEKLWSVVDRNINLPDPLRNYLANLCEKYNCLW